MFPGRFTAVVFLCGLLLVATATTASAAACAKPDEYQALQRKVTQVELMVSALSCQQRDLYNTFIREQSANLGASSQLIKSFFKRRQINLGETGFANFLTELANQASRNGLKQDFAAYCDESKSSLRHYQSTKADLVESPFFKKMSSKYNFKQCTSTQLAALDE